MDAEMQHSRLLPLEIVGATNYHQGQGGWLLEQW